MVVLVRKREDKRSRALQPGYSYGQLGSEINFGTGASTYWFPNGQKQSEGITLTDMQKDGKWTGWHDNGIKNFEGTYKAGKKVGVWTWYNEKGEKTAEQVYNDGTLLSTKEY
jgi:antitoxin component YwqK of YwqJK toxin-antitoxin module